MVYKFTSGNFFFQFNAQAYTQKGREPQLRFILVLEKYFFFFKEVRLIQNNAATSDATPQSVLS